MTSYEAMLIFKPNLKEDQQKALLTELENVLKGEQAKVGNTQLFGKRQLAYEINKCKEGLYYLMNFSTQMGAPVSKLKQAAKLNENILRVLIVKKRAKQAKR